MKTILKVIILLLFITILIRLIILRLTVGIDMTDIRFIIEYKWEYLLMLIFSFLGGVLSKWH